MAIPEPAGDERTVYEGKIFEVVEQDMRIGDKKVTFETCRRSPGVRLLIAKNGKILLTKEYRAELQGYDYRLPGGKVFDTLSSYKKNKNNILGMAEKSARKECEEETGLIPMKLKHIHTTSPGGTVDWQLFYFLVEDFETGRKSPGDGEKIENFWKTFDEVKKMCLDKQIKEDRSVGVILRFLSR